MAEREYGGSPPKSETPTAAERRDGERLPAREQVLVGVSPVDLPGPSKDISRQGLYFLTDRSLTVEVVFEDGTRVPGELVRLEKVREGEIGIAVRFDRPLPENLLPEG